MDGELALALLPGREGIQQELSEWRGDGRALCPVPVVQEWALRVIEEEADAREWGGRPRTRWDLEAWRVIRSERAAVQDEWRKRMEKKAST